MIKGSSFEILSTRSVHDGSIGEKGQLTQADIIDFSHSQPTVCEFHWEITGNKWICVGDEDGAKINTK